MKRRALGWTVAAAVVAGLVIPDILLASPGSSRIVWTLAAAVLTGVTLARPRALRVVADLLGRPRTAHVLLACWIVGGLVAQFLKVRAMSDVHGQDQAYHVQVLWNTLQGRFGEGTILQQLYFDPPLRNHFGLHVSPALFALLPAFALVPHVGTLLVVKVFAPALGAYVLLRLATGVLDRATSTAAMAAYLLHPTVLGQWTHDFYPAVMAGPALLLAFLAWERQRIGWFAVALLGLLCVREDIGLTTCAFAGVAVLERLARGSTFRGWRWALLPTSMGLGWYLVCSRLVMPWGGGMAVAANVTEWYGVHGDTPREIVTTILGDPIHTMSVVFASAKLLYLWQMLRPFLALPLLGRAAVVAIPAVAINVLVSHAGPTLDPNGHYSIVVGAALAVALVAALRTVSERAGQSGALTLAIVVLGASLTAVPDALNTTSIQRLRPRAHATALADALARVPPHASVAAPSGCLSLVATTHSAYAVDRFGHYPEDLGRPEAVVLDLHAERLELPHKRQGPYARRVALFTGDAAYERVFERDGVLLLLRRDGDRASVR